MDHLTGRIEQWAVRIICACSLILIGFAHQPPAVVADGLSPAELAQYTLPNGTAPSLCTTAGDKSGNHAHDKAHWHDCEACRISASVLTPTPADAAGERLRIATAIERPIRVEAFHRQLFPPNTGPRAPPLQSNLA